ncbi:MAG: hypothetical protein NTX25_05615 [Proteobacteria bacterium]|nr:hypothetical protein [Pseudomonadota bacterium]
MSKFLKMTLMSFSFMTMASPLLANSKSLFLNGVNAATYGDLSVDKGEWRDHESFSALRLKAGIQLIRVGFVGLTLGYQKVGFYTAEKNWSKEYTNKTHFDYTGPVAELHLFPEALIGFSLAGTKATGFSVRTDSAGGSAFGLDCENQVKCAAIDTERSNLEITEFSGQINYRIRQSLQIFLGMGIRHLRGEPSYEIKETDSKTHEVTSHTESLGQATWYLDSKFILLGIRGSNL